MPGKCPRDVGQRVHRGIDRCVVDLEWVAKRMRTLHARKICPKARRAMEIRSIDAIVAMVSAGLGVSIVPRPRAALLAAHGVREVALGKGGPVRRVAFVQRRNDLGNRNLDAVFRAFGRT